MYTLNFLKKRIKAAQKKSREIKKQKDIQSAVIPPPRKKEAIIYFRSAIKKSVRGARKLFRFILRLPFWPLMFVLNFGKKKIKAYLRRRQAKKIDAGEIIAVKPARQAEEKILPVATTINLPEKKKETVIPASQPGGKRSFSGKKLLNKLLSLPFLPLMFVLNFGKKKLKAYLRKQRQKDEFGEEKNVKPAEKTEEKPVETKKEILPAVPIVSAPVVLEPTIIEKQAVKSVSKKVAFPKKLEGIWQVSELTPPANVETDRLIAPSEIGPGQKQTFRQRTANLLKESLLTLRPTRRAIIVFLIVLGIGVFSFGPLRQTEDKFINRPQVTEQGTSKPEEGEEGSVLGEKKTNVAESPVVAKIKLTFGQLIGHGLAAIALLFGSFFFIYSVKYYLTIILVMLASQGINQGKKMGRASSFFYRLFFKDASNGNGNGHNGAIGLLPNFQEEKPLTSYPFVSIQLPFYNEKKVVNRILTACTSFDYPNYEVIVADDSTDETIEILAQWQNHPRVKILHRENRAGFKGAALREAMKIKDPKTEFVVIFDADFIPYPDTIKQFLKYFLVNGNGNGNGNGIHSYKDTNIAAVQGYQWHVLNKNENWITRSVRTEFSGSYVIERPGAELVGGLKQIAGSVYMIRSDVLSAYSWTDSITEDFELTLRIYRDGWKVIFTPYIQAPAECVSTIKRLIRQRMRWAEGHSSNIRRYFWSMLKSPYMSRREKAEFLYLAPYYLQSAFLLIGTFCWFVSDVLLHAQLPFWTDLWGWSLVFVNLFALPLLNAVGLFFEESEERDYLGTFSFVALCYILAPFQALAAVRGLFKKEGGWFRTPKSGHITDLYFRSRYRRWFKSLFPGRKKKSAKDKRPDVQYLKLATSHSTFQDFKVKKRKGARKIANIISLLLIVATLALQFLSDRLPSTPDKNNNLSQSQERLSFVGLDQDHDKDNTFETDGAKQLAKSNIITGPAKTEEKAVTAPSQKKAAADNSPRSSNITGQENINLPNPKNTEANQPPEIDENNPNLVNSPNGPVLLKDDLPEKIKLAVKTAYANWPEGEEEVELNTLRTQKSKQVLTENGQIRQEIANAPLHYADAEGQWQDISTEIKPVEDFQITSTDTYQYANTANNFQAYFKNDEADPNYVKVEYKGKKISFSLPAAVSADIQPVVNDNIITYPEVYPGVDLRYTIFLDNVLEEYIVKTREALANLPILTQEFSAENTTFAQEEDKLQFRENLAGTKLWHFPKPVVYELNNQDARNYGLHREVENLGDKFFTKKILDQEGIDWLNSPDRQFPVVIDDSTVVDYTDTNYLDGHVKYDGSTYTTVDTDPVKFGQNTTPDPDETYRGYVKFDITDLSDSTTYSQVDIYVRSYDAQAAGKYADITALPVDPNGRSATNIYSDISGATVYVDNATSFRTANGDYVFNLGSTALTDLNSALAGNWFGFGIKSDGESADWGSLRSEEYATTNKRPRLSAIYNVIMTSSTYVQSYVHRNSFFDETNGKYWLIMCDRSTGTTNGYYSSDDGATWTKDSANYFTGSDFINTWYDITNNKVYATYPASYDVKLRIGTVNSSSITWSDAYVATDGTGSSDNHNFTAITKEADGYCWVGSRRYNGTNYYVSANKSTNTDCTTWGTKADISAGTTNAFDNLVEIVPVSSDGDVYLTWQEGTSIKGRRWDDSGSAWNAVDTIATTNTSSPGWRPSAVHDANYDLHLLYFDTAYDPTYKKYDESAATWGSSLAIYTGIENNGNISYDTNTNEIYASWLYWFSDLYAVISRYKKCDTDNDCTNISNWTPNTVGSATTLATEFNLQAPAASYWANGRAWVMISEGVYSADILHMVIPENVWLLIPIIAFLPKQIQKLLSKGRRKKKRSFRLTSVFGFKKKK